MKKMISVFTVLSMIFALALPSLAVMAEDFGLEEAIIAAKSKIEIPEEYSEFSSSISEGRDGKVYALRWSTEKSDDLDSSFMNISVDEDGNITYYSGHDDFQTWNSSPRLPVFNSEQVRQIAHDWIGEINPS